ncbi:MAG: 1-acyl-sn-glycerol-3-phosphate acyltransferase [Prolixibacteraceae bacterium]|nr:1-acyl-sn-glycerol-3-phosphate acyltransferase [Prolixibacteraceae bacterium]MBN2649777.1 1-acyl-sn-glycerol-3-phosphate acyltransferase [Prolixibacteraceae bacterium]
MKNVEDRSLIYTILKFCTSIVHRFTLKHFTINGLENIPRGQPIIFAPNHQNALLDPLAVVFASKSEPIFLARADIFKNKFIARFLNAIKIAPVYRIRDGKESLGKNKDVFENSVRILQNNHSLCLFPEGKHVGMKSMDPHKKAIPRIVFIAAELTNFDLDINIVPVGINYSHYYKFRRNVTINFGEPIKTKAYYDIYKTVGETKASNAMRTDIFEAVRKLVVHVPNKNHYELYEQAFEMMRNETAQKLGVARMHKYFVDIERYITSKIADKLSDNDDLGDQFTQKATKYQALKEKLKLRERALVKGKIGFGKTALSFFVMLLLLPFGIYGALANGWVFYVTRYPYRKKIKDRQFWSTFSFGLSFVLYYLWLIILVFILTALFHNWLLAVILALVSIPSGIVAWETGQLFLQVIRRLRFNWLQRQNSTTFAQMMELRAELYNFYQNSIS